MPLNNLLFRITETCFFIASIALYILSITYTLIHRYYFFLYPILMSLHYYLCIFFDENKLEESIEMCNNCKIFHIKNVEHCEICRRCYFKRDHHCWLVGKCINYNNYKDFFWFLLFTVVLLGLLAFTAKSFVCFMGFVVLSCYFTFLNLAWAQNFMTKEFNCTQRMVLSINTWWNVVFDGSFQNVLIGFFPFRKLNINFLNENINEEYSL